MKVVAVVAALTHLILLLVWDQQRDLLKEVVFLKVEGLTGHIPLDQEHPVNQPQKRFEVFLMIFYFNVFFNISEGNP